MLKANKDEILRVKIFQSTMNTIRQSLKSQALFLSDFINKDVLELQFVKDGSSEAGIGQ